MDSFNKVKDENEKIKAKIFFLENVINKKDNLIISLKKKYDKIVNNVIDNSSKNLIEKEYYVKNLIKLDN